MYKNVAAPRLRECPLNFSGEKPALDKRVLSLVVKSLWVIKETEPDFVLYEKAGESGGALVLLNKRSR